MLEEVMTDLLKAIGWYPGLGPANAYTGVFDGLMGVILQDLVPHTAEKLAAKVLAYVLHTLEQGRQLGLTEWGKTLDSKVDYASEVSSLSSDSESD
jgi:hypothetical protein